MIERNSKGYHCLDDEKQMGVIYMKIVAIAGSNGKNSNNKKLLNFMKSRYEDKIDMEILYFCEL